jgi:hypothetical protein
LYSPHHRVLEFLRLCREWIQFKQRHFAAPSPTLFKRQTLMSHSNPHGKWIETGTYMGSTTRYLGKRFTKVISIEPSPEFFRYSKSKLQKYKNITVVNGTSEELFERALLDSAPITNIWLDGHFSEGNTFLGEKVSPIEAELNSVAKNINLFQDLVLFVDDVRLFPRSSHVVTGYPSFQWLIDWCSVNKFEWQIQNDILIATLNRSIKSAE